jgi:hypothetical protein
MTVNKKTFIAASIIVTVFIISLALSLQSVKITEANFYMPPNNATFQITSPDWLTYGTTILCINFTVEHNLFLPFGYILDGKPLVLVNTEMVSKVLLPQDYQAGNGPFYRYTDKGSAVLSNLTEGFHKLEICAFVSYTWTPDQVIDSSAIVCFTVNTLTPAINILSPTGLNYNTTSIPLTFTVTKTATTQYSLDGQTNVTINGNATITGLSFGSHTLIVYAEDTIGNRGKSQEVQFVINNQPSTSPIPRIISSPTPSPILSPTTSLLQTPNPINPNIPPSSNSPTLQPTIEHSQTLDSIQGENFAQLIIIFSLVIVAVLMGALVYFKKIKK